MEFIAAVALIIVNLWNGSGMSLTAFTNMIAMFLKNRHLHQLALANAAMRQIEAKNRRIFRKAVRNIGTYYRGRDFTSTNPNFADLFKITGNDVSTARDKFWAIEKYCKSQYPNKFPKETKTTLKKMLRNATSWEMKETWNTAYKLWAKPTVKDAVDLAEFKANWICTVDTTAMKNQEEVLFIFKGSSWLVDCIYNHKDKTAGITMKQGRTRYYFFSVPITALMLVVEKNGKQMWDGFGWLFSTNPFHWVRRRGFKIDGGIKKNYEKMLTNRGLNYWKYSKNAKKGKTK